MNVNDANIGLVYKGWQSVYNQAFDDTTSHSKKIAMEVISSTSEENYGWLGQFPALREWIGPRQIEQLASHGFKIINKKWESTIKVTREDFEDDRYGVYTPMISEMGRLAKQHPDLMIFAMLATGFTELCYDGKPFFSDDHPISQKPDAPAEDPVASNFQAGTGPGWYLLDASRAIKPMIWQVRDKYEMTSVTDPRDSSVFMNDEFVFGVRARVNCGFGLWQLAFGSKAELTEENYFAARSAMMKYTGDRGQLLGVTPTHLVVSPDNELAARNILNADMISSSSNVWKGSAELIVSPFLA